MAYNINLTNIKINVQLFIIKFSSQDHTETGYLNLLHIHQSWIKTYDHRNNSQMVICKEDLGDQYTSEALLDVKKYKYKYYI